MVLKDRRSATLSAPPSAGGAAGLKETTEVVKNGVDIGKSAVVLIVVLLAIFNDDFLRSIMNNMDIEKITIGNTEFSRSTARDSIVASGDALPKSQQALTAAQTELDSLRTRYAQSVEALRASQVAAQTQTKPDARPAVALQAQRAQRLTTAALREAPQAIRSAERMTELVENAAASTGRAIRTLPRASDATGFAVVFGGDSSEEAARDQLRAARKSGIRNLHIFHRQGSFRSVAVFPSRSAAAAELSRIRRLNRYSADAYIVDLATWCPGVPPTSEVVECAP